MLILPEFRTGSFDSESGPRKEISVADPGCIMPDPDPNIFSSRILHTKRDIKKIRAYLFCYLWIPDASFSR
jgi:hypothetical protein